MLIAYTDGSCKGNGKEFSEGGFGVVIVDENDNIIHQFQNFEKNTTNNIQELKAILWTMTKFGKNDPPLFVYSDSAYAVNTLTNWMYGWEQNGWVKGDGKRPENVGIIKAYRTLEKLGHKIVLLKCSGHSGDKWNEYADKLATGKIIIENKKEEENAD